MPLLHFLSQYSASSIRHESITLSSMELNQNIQAVQRIYVGTMCTLDVNTGLRSHYGKVIAVIFQLQRAVIVLLHDTYG
ncbi:unnamed protein product [Albugo candida]|uniref:Uncharacterized protein n=1 Tax=Albugo candida TaxID=65357 RepID=A0A024G578_9STRA|nr:unnamed protein product [Albugo candida]|eukprot:CCI41827.1 unnamed protein product [Albugo candida]